MKKKVLILDDNPQNNKMYIEEVKKDYDVDKAMKPISVMRLIHHTQYDYIVIDVMMPMDKYEAKDETSTGFVFYRDELMPMSLTSPIIFWSRLEKDAYDIFWKDTPPANTFFLHKNSEESHLRDFINLIDKEQATKQ